MTKLMEWLVSNRQNYIVFGSLTLIKIRIKMQNFDIFVAVNERNKKPMFYTTKPEIKEKEGVEQLIEKTLSSFL